MKLKDQKPTLYKQIQNKFNHLDSDSSGRLDIEEVHSLLKELQISLKKHQLKEFVKQNDKNNDQQLDFEEFFNFYLDLVKKEELIPIFTKYCAQFRKKSEKSDNDTHKKYYKALMTKIEFTEFMRHE